MERITVIESVLTELGQRNIAYSVLRNYDFLLERRTTLSASERSVDMVVSRADFSRFENLMKEFQFQQRKPQFSRKHHAYFHVIDGGEVVSFDVQVGGVYWNDMLYLDEKNIVGNRIKKSFFYVPSDNDSFVMLLVHSILGKRYFKPEYQETLSTLITKIDKKYALEQLIGLFGVPASLELVKSVELGAFDLILENKYRNIIYFLSRKRRWLIFFPLLFRWLRWKRFLQPYPLISIIGPDGAGKSTLAAALAEYLRAHNRKVEVIYTGRGRNQLLPFGTLGRKYKHQERQKDKIRDPVLWKRKVLYTLSAPIFALDLGLRYLMEIMPSRRTRKIVITDRYCTDIWLMKHVPLALKKWLLYFFPRPTLTFYLYNTPKVLHQRREEEPLAELQRQLALFAKLEQLLPIIKIKTETAAKTSQEVFEKTISFMYFNWY